MVAPGAKGWIAKYFQLIEMGEIKLTFQKPEELTRAQFNHHFLGQSGIVFGFPTKLLFSSKLDNSKWTQDETLKVLLFESLLFTYLNVKKVNQVDPQVFIDELELFYKNHRVQSMGSFLGYILKETKAEKLERILGKRTEVTKHLRNTKSWMSYFNNVFIYLDVLLFEDFLKSHHKPTLDYQQLAMLSLAVISMTAYSDGTIDPTEKTLFDTFLLSADLNSDEKELAKMRFKDGISLNELTADLVDSWNFKRYLLDLSALTIFVNHNAGEQEELFMQQLKAWLGSSDRDLDEAIYVAEQFVLENNQRINYLQDSSSVEKMVDNVSKRWIKILGRNKDKLAVEIKQSKELVSLIRKSASEELTKEEKDKVKTQFLDIVKSMPALAIFLLPGGAVLLPIVLKIIPNLVPSAFKENELEE